MMSTGALQREARQDTHVRTDSTTHLVEPLKAAAVGVKDLIIVLYERAPNLLEIAHHCR